MRVIHRVSDLPPPARWGNVPIGHLNRLGQSNLIVGDASAREENQ
jgi:hypothetical protein